MDIPDRTSPDKYYYHVYDYDGSVAFEPSPAVGEQKVRYYSLVQDLRELVRKANDKNIPVKLFSLYPFTNPGNREIFVLRFGGNPRKRVLFTGGIHGCERLAVEIPYLIAEYLIKNYPDPNTVQMPSDKQSVIKHLVDNRDIFVAPMLNPDGHMHAMFSDETLWRINRRKLIPANDFTLKKGFFLQLTSNLIYHASQYNPPSGIELDPQRLRVIEFDPGAVTDGVDLNRNFPGPEWGYECYDKDGLRSASGDPVAETNERNTYFGPCVNSEPETQAVMQLFTQFGPFLASIDYHSYGKMILYPENAANDGQVIRMAQCMSRLTVVKEGDEEYEYKAPSKWLYPAFSSVMDYSYQLAPSRRTRKPYAFTIELEPPEGTGSSIGFRPPRTFIGFVFERNIRGALALIGCAGKYLDPTITPPYCRLFARWAVKGCGNNLPE
jgi:hypothetical protein